MTDSEAIKELRKKLILSQTTQNFLQFQISKKMAHIRKVYAFKLPFLHI